MLMKILFCTLSILLSTAGSFAQNSPSTPEVQKKLPIISIEAVTRDNKVVILKSDGTWDYAPNQPPAPQTTQTSEAPPISNTVPIEVETKDVQIFPQKYLNQLVHFKRLEVGDPADANIPNMTVYALSLRSFDDVVFYNFVNYSQLNFVLDDEFADAIVKFKRKNSGLQQIGYPANIDAEIRQVIVPDGRKLNLAKVTCVQFTGAFGLKFEPIGQCPNVKRKKKKEK